ncbi:OmpH family outer membrane protein [Sphingobacterium thalpophilum]|uniref:OmpH family outer membrane protein n=1 Tax=Sphingobacterium thalpophilum TaxID=259 RepID=UPI0031D58BFF
MKSIQALWASVMVILGLCTYLLFSKQEKIAYVESTRIFQDYKGAKFERDKLESRRKEFKLKIDTLSREVREAIIHYDGQSDSKTKQLIQFKEKQLDDYRRSVEQTLHTEESAAMSKVAAELNAFLKDYGKRNNYKFIFIASSSGTIAYAAEGTNVTEDVLKEINGK